MNYQKINRFWLRPSMHPYQWLLWLHLPLLMFHESEEYVLSPTSFKEFFNLKTFAGSRSDPDYPLDESYVFQVNLVFAWPIIILGAILAPVIPWLGFSMIWFELVINNIMHTVLFQGTKPTYNPGLITNPFLLLPYGTWTLLTAIGFFTPLDWALSIVAGEAIVVFLRPRPGDGWLVHKEPGPGGPLTGMSAGGKRVQQSPALQDLRRTADGRALYVRIGSFPFLELFLPGRTPKGHTVPEARGAGRKPLGDC